MVKATDELGKLKRDVAALKRRVASLEREDLGAPLSPEERRAYERSLVEQREGRLVDFNQWYQRRFGSNKQELSKRS